MKKLVSFFAVLLAANQFAFSQIEEKNVPVVNDLTIEMPQAVYPETARHQCIKGEVRVLVEYKTAGGNPLPVKVLSGDSLLWDAAIEAAKKAVFKRINNTRDELRGILTYTFPPPPRTVCLFKNDVVNNLMKSFPALYIKNLVAAGHLSIQKETRIKVVIVVAESGEVVYASAVTNTGLPLLEKHAEILARQVKFAYLNDVGQVRVRCYLLFTIKPSGDVGL